MRINGVWVTAETELRQGIVQAFKTVLTNTGEWRASLDGLSFPKLNEEAPRLEMPFTEEDVFTSLSNLNGDKALSPDGFTIAFWQCSWDIVKVNIRRMFTDFFETRKFVKNLNTTFPVMLPKIGGVEDFKDYRPISLVGSLYKLIAKVLANMLKKVMNGLINRAQNALVEGRQIMDALLSTNEILDTMMKRNEKGILCKLDIEKAYDQINWNYIINVLQKMGFGDKWVRWIKWCILTTSFSILINPILIAQGG